MYQASNHVAPYSGQIPDDALGYFSELLKADPEVVLAYVQQNGCALKDAAPSLRQDLDIVCAASDTNVSALVHCTGVVQQRLGRDKTFMKHILTQSQFGYHRGDPAIYAMLSPDLKLDRDMIVAAHVGDCLDVSDLPQELAQDPEFWKDALGESCLFWMDLPNTFKHDISFPRCITDLVTEIVELHPDLSADVDFWRDSILSSTSDFDCEELLDLIEEIGSSVRNNRALMLLACSRAGDLLPALPREFMLDREFVEVTVQESDYALLGLPFEAQLLYPDLVALAISKFHDDLFEYTGKVNPELWSNPVVAEAWFGSEGPIHDGIPDRMKEDPEYCLLIVEYCGVQEADDFVRSKRIQQLIYWPTKGWRRITTLLLLVLEVLILMNSLTNLLNWTMSTHLCTCNPSCTRFNASCVPTMASLASSVGCLLTLAPGVNFLCYSKGRKQHWH